MRVRRPGSIHPIYLRLQEPSITAPLMHRCVMTSPRCSNFTHPSIHEIERNAINDDKNAFYREKLVPFCATSQSHVTLDPCSKDGQRWGAMILKPPVSDRCSIIPIRYDRNRGFAGSWNVCFGYRNVSNFFVASL